MNRIAIVGAQWGDEGKGKVVNYFAPQFDWIVRYSGGSNAGHTIYVGEKKYVNHLLPSLDVKGSSRAYLGAGMVIDLEQLLKELDTLEADFPGVSARFAVDPEAAVVLPWHKQEDRILEGMRRHPIGTTGRGIGPCYTDRAARLGVKLYDISDSARLAERLEEAWHIKKQLYGEKLSMEPREVAGYLQRIGERIAARSVRFTSAVEMAEVFRSTTVLFEGAQGVLLDMDFGTYPFVTSSSTMAHGVSSVGFSTFELNEVYGVLKAYTTRVGAGPFPTEEHGPLGEEIRRKGSEFGATTGRPRRVGWLDLPALRYARARSGLTSFIVTKADVLDGYESIRVCVAYRIRGERRELPHTSHDFFSAEPVYETLPGWPNTRHPNFLRYLAFIEEHTGIEVKHISYGPRTHEMITRNRLTLEL
jgi:adenylosuccinate synthase